jgi:cyclopropane-fatty-acyl-phospholipid synthase
MSDTAPVLTAVPAADRPPVRVDRPHLVVGERPRPLGRLTHPAARAVLLAALERITGGEVGLLERSGRLRWFGQPSSGPGGRDPLRAVLRVHHPGAYEAVLLRGSIGLGTSYADGWWDTDDLPTLLRLLERNVRRGDPARRSVRRLTGPVTDGMRRLRRPDPEQDRDDIRAHYDLGNDFFERWLDETMMYSSAIFPTEDATLAEASVHKLDRLCSRLSLGPGDHVLEIGTGWGGFAVHAARRYGCRVTTTTISDEQFTYATARVRAAGLADRITVLDQDYREVRGQYDAIVSIEMIEAVDWREYDSFFAACDRLLRPGGRLGMQAILIPHQRFDLAKARRDFIKAVIFPGGCLPSIDALLRSSSRVSDLSLVDLEDIGLHYAETLRRWRANFDAACDGLPELGLDRRFSRLWEFYLAYCEAGFDEQDITAVQFVLARPGWRPPT